jgi:hypothetical protein
LFCERQPTLLFTENETNSRRLYGDQEGARYVKDSFHGYVIHGDKEAVNPDKIGSKAAAHYTLTLTLAPGASDLIHLRFTHKEDATSLARHQFDETFKKRIQEANEFYDSLAHLTCPKMRGAFSGRPSPDSSGANSSITTISSAGSTAIPACRSRRANACAAAMRTGRISTTPT